MASYTVGPEMTFEAGATLAQYTLVKMGSGGTITNSTGVASEDNDVFGVVQEAASSGDSVLVTNLNNIASFKVKCAGAISKGAKVYTAASGLATATATSLTMIGLARDAATAANDIIEVLRVLGSNDDIS
jgi:predicted RecA/RadA family phage recombinase